MKITHANFIQYLYTFLLRLYPREFQHEFASEMLQVFNEASQHAQVQGFRSSWAFLLKELFDLPSSLLREYGWTLFRKEVRMSGVLNLQPNAGGMSAGLGFSEPPASRKEIFLAGLPFLVVAYTGLSTLLMGLGVVSSESKFFSILSIVLGIGMLLVALWVFIYARRKHFPRWSAVWYGFWLVAVLTPFIMLLNLWDPSQFFYDFVQPLLWAFILLGIAWFLYRLSSQDALKGVLAALPVMGMTWIIHQEFVPDDIEGSIALASWLLIGLAAITIIRLNNLKAGVLLALGTNFLIGLAYAYEGIYFGGTLNFDAPGANWIQVLRSFLPHWITISTLVIGPLLARQYRELGYRLQPLGLWLYRLVLLGLLLILVSNVAESMMYTGNFPRYYLQTQYLILNILAWAGFAVFCVAFFLLSRKAIQNKAVTKPPLLWLLGIFSLLVPFGLALGLPHRLIWPSFSLYNDIWAFFHSSSPVSQFPELWPVSLGLLWALGAAWLAIFLNHPEKPSEVNRLI